MRASLRWNLILSAGLLVMGQAALAQSVPDAASNTPATDAIGPRELQDFSLPGTAAKPADQTSTAPAATPPAREKPVQANISESTQRPLRETLRRTTSTAASVPQAATKVSASPSNSVALRHSETIASTAAPAAAVPLGQTLLAPAPPPASHANGSTAPIAPEQRLSMLPWLLAALAVAGATGFIFWRRKGVYEAAGAASNYDRYASPETVPAAPPLPRAPVAAPQPAAPQRPEVSPQRPEVPRAAVPRGIVSSRLRPSLELGMQPLSCLVDDEQVTIEFEVELFNSGTAPARAVIAEASLLNASATQEQELAAFYAKAPAHGDRIDSIPPLKRMTFKNRVVAPRAAVQEYELAGRKAFVPVLAFNAQYEWSGGKGQSSLAFLLGRETRGEKLGPLHLDGARREVRQLGARVLPTAVRT